MAGELSFLEFGVEDPERARSFYEGLFGWSSRPGPSGQGFVLDLPNVPAGVHGGDKGASPYVFFAVDDIDAAVERVKELGGEVLDMDVEGGEDAQKDFGRFKICKDDQGSGFGLHQRPSG